MAKIIFDYSKGKREYLETLYSESVLGLSKTIENKDVAMFIAALGIDSPTEITQRDGGGWFRVENVTRYSDDKAFICSFLLGTAKTDEEVNQFSKLEEYINYMERCAENGFHVLNEMIQDVNGNNELLERKLMQHLDFLYIKNVENDI